MDVQIEEDSARIILEESIDLSNAEELKEEFMSVTEQGITDVTLDFNRVKKIDSSGLGKILLFQKILREEDGKLIIENVDSEYVREVFDMVHLDEVVEIR